MFRSAASSAQPHQLLACGCNAHDSIPVLLALRSQSFDCFAAWVLDSTCRPCLSDRMLAIIYVLAGRGVFLVQYLLQSLVSFTLCYWTLSSAAVARILRVEDVVDSKHHIMPGFASHGGCWRHKS